MLRVVYCGTPDIAVPALQTLANNKSVSIELVISQPDRAAGRGQKLKSPEVIEFARQLGLPTFQTENINREDELLCKLESDPPDLFIVFAFAQFLGSRILGLPKLGCFNIHTSLLPRHRGAAPIHYGIWCGDSVGGVSIQRMVKKMDAGDICISLQIPIGARETTPELYERLKPLSATALEALIDHIVNQQLRFTTQDESLVTCAPVIKKEDGFINFSVHDAYEVDRRVRAFKPWPGVQILLGTKRCKLTNVIPSNKSVATGELKLVDKSLFLGLANQTSIEILELQPEGKPNMTTQAWLNGQQGVLPTVAIIGDSHD